MGPRTRVRSIATLLVGVMVVVVVLVVGAPVASAATRRVSPFRGLGTWVDVYDYAPAFQSGGAVPSVTPESVEDMAGLGVKTLYLQAAQDDRRSVGDLAEPTLAAQFLRRAHAKRMQVVAWYVPHFDDLDGDLRRITALHDFRARGQRFDAIALDIEYTEAVRDPVTRSTALVEVSRRARERVGDLPFGAIVLEPVLLEVVNPSFWPDFPWRRIRDRYDAWLPMSYWTNRSRDSGYREGYRYADENIRRLRADVGRADLPVHAVGGVADATTAADVAGFVRAARRQRATGWSLYDFATTTSGLWPRLRAGSGS